jgi:hypothetical protein
MLTKITDGDAKLWEIHANNTFESWKRSAEVVDQAVEPHITHRIA